MRILLGLPFLVIPVAAYHVLVYITSTPIDLPVFSTLLPSEATFAPSWGHLLIAVGLLFLYIEIFKSTRTGTASIIDHMLSMLLMLICVVEFILLAEMHKLERHQIPKIAQNDAGTALRALSEELAAFASRLRPRQAETAYNLASMIDPSNARAMYGLAKGYYASKRYQEAKSMFEQAIPLCEAVLDTAKRLDVRSLRRDSDDASEDMETIFEKAQEMYEDCLERV